MSDYMRFVTVSGKIEARKDAYADCGYEYAFTSGCSRWGIPTDGVTPEDFRKLADHLERAIAEKQQASE